MTSFATTFAEIRRHQNRGAGVLARSIARRAALDVLSLATAARAEHALDRPRVQILYLHHVMRDEEQQFRALIEWLLRRHTFLSYSEAVGRIASGVIDRPYVSITFDDGLRNQLRAAEILGDYGISACSFVCDALAEARPFEWIRDFCRRELWLPPVDFLGWSDFERLLRAGHEIGNHTSNHRNLATLRPSELTDEISASLQNLRRHLGDVQHFAWPRGRAHEMTHAALAEVFRAGHSSCASAMRGAHVPGAARALADVCIRRDTIIAAEPLRHTRYFLAQSSRNATDANRDWPREWGALSFE